MPDLKVINDLVQFTQSKNGIGDKGKLSDLVKKQFALTQKRSVFYCDNFAIRFCSSKSINMGNTVLALSSLKKYDHIPFLVCIVTPTENHLLLANTTFLSKISHSSQELRVDNIKGSFNGPDIMRVVSGIKNEPKNFIDLFLFHENFTFEENLERLVEKTNLIAPTGKRFEPTEEERARILEAPIRAKRFIDSVEYHDLKNDLDNRVKSVKTEIAIAVSIDNVKIRGGVIEYLITSNSDSLKEQIINSLHSGKPLPQFKIEDNLGDYSKQYENYLIETEIKSKVLILNSNPKGYNIDKLLRFLSGEKTVYMIYLVGIEDTGEISTALCSVFDKELLSGTVFLTHWAGRNSRGVTQFYGKSLEKILRNPQNIIDFEIANAHLLNMLSM